MEQGYVKSVVWHLRQNFTIILPVNYPSAFADIVLVHFQIAQSNPGNRSNSSEWPLQSIWS